MDQHLVATACTSAAATKESVSGTTSHHPKTHTIPCPADTLSYQQDTRYTNHLLDTPTTCTKL